MPNGSVDISTVGVGISARTMRSELASSAMYRYVPPLKASIATAPCMEEVPPTSPTSNSFWRRPSSSNLKTMSAWSTGRKLARVWLYAIALRPPSWKLWFLSSKKNWRPTSFPLAGSSSNASTLHPWLCDWTTIRFSPSLVKPPGALPMECNSNRRSSEPSCGSKTAIFWGDPQHSWISMPTNSSPSKNVTENALSVPTSKSRTIDGVVVTIEASMTMM